MIGDVIASVCPQLKHALTKPLLHEHEVRRHPVRSAHKRSSLLAMVFKLRHVGW